MYPDVMARPRGYKQRIDTTLKRLRKKYPKVKTALDHKNAYELSVATILSAQCTDVRVNIVTPTLFKKYPTLEAMAKAKQSDVEKLIRTTGFYKNKAKNIIAMAQKVIAEFEGEIPQDRDDLTSLSGIGRKTANVIRSNGYNLPGLPVDTHVMRLSGRLKLTNEKDPVKIEHDLGDSIPEDDWGKFSLLLIEHGRQICIARKPKCDQCILNDYCPSAFTF
jgi:endonuclease-3